MHFLPYGFVYLESTWITEISSQFFQLHFFEKLPSKLFSAKEGKEGGSFCWGLLLMETGSYCKLANTGDRSVNAALAGFSLLN